MGRGRQRLERLENLGSIPDTASVITSAADPSLPNSTVLSDGNQTTVSIVGSTIVVDVVEGSGSGLDADTVDGQHASDFQPVDAQLTSLAGLSYSGNATKVVAVKADESGFELVSGGSGVTDGDKGDIIVSSSGATWDVDNNAVTYAKMQDVSAASKLLGRGDSGSGDPEEITLGAGLSIVGNTLSVSGTTIFKTSDESRNSTTALADDSELTVYLDVGSYRIHLHAEYVVAATAMGYKNAVSFTGTISNGRGSSGSYVAGTAGGTSAEFQSVNSSWPFGTGTHSTTAANSLGYVDRDIFIEVSAAGTFSYQWAQNVSNGSNATTLKGSYIEVITL